MKDFCKLIRWPNIIFIGILLWTMEYWVAAPVLSKLHWGNPLPVWLFICLAVATMLIAAGGYIINDYFDIKIDRINRPDRLIITQSVSKERAMLYYKATTAAGVVAGIIAAIVSHSWTLALIFLVVPGLLWFYSSSYKRQLIIGNIIIAFTAALTPMLIAFIHIGLLKARYGDIIAYTSLEHDLYLWLGGFSVFAFLTTWIREIVKDLQDQIGDRELECHTLPIVIGTPWTCAIATLLIVIVIVLLCLTTFYWLPFPHTWSDISTRYLVFGLLIPLLGEICLIWSAKIPSDYRSAQGLMKFVMFIGTLYSFVICRLL